MHRCGNIAVGCRLICDGVVKLSHELCSYKKVMGLVLSHMSTANLFSLYQVHSYLLIFPSVNRV